MDEVVGRLETMTSEFVKSLDTTDVDAIAEFVEKRQTLLDEFGKLREQSALFATSKEDDAKIGDRLKHVLSYDALINDRMQKLMNDTMQQLTKINQNRKRDQAYNPGYTPDSVYFDKKK